MLQQQMEEEVTRIRIQLKKKYPSIQFFELHTCGTCGSKSAIYPVYGMDGLPTTKFRCTIFSLGDKKSGFFDGGSLPEPGNVHDMGQGCFVASLPIRIVERDASLETAFLKAAFEISQREEWYLAKVLTTA